MGSPSRRGRGIGTSSVAARQDRVLWSGTVRSSPSSWTMEPIRPSVWRSAKRNTALSVSAVRIAFMTLRFCLGMWWGRFSFSLKGKVGIRGQGRTSYAGSVSDATARVHATRSRAGVSANCGTNPIHALPASLGPVGHIAPLRIPQPLDRLGVCERDYPNTSRVNALYQSSASRLTRRRVPALSLTLLMKMSRALIVPPLGSKLLALLTASSAAR